MVKLEFLQYIYVKNYTVYHIIIFYLSEGDYDPLEMFITFGSGLNIILNCTN